MLSSNLTQQFAKMIVAKSASESTSQLYGTVKTVSTDGETGSVFVQLDGSDRITPAATTITVYEGDRVTVDISNHQAVITGSTTNHAVTTGQLPEVVDAVIEEAVIEITAEDSVLDRIAKAAQQDHADALAAIAEINTAEGILNTLSSGDDGLFTSENGQLYIKSTFVKSASLSADILAGGKLISTNFGVSESDVDSTTGEVNDLPTELNYGASGLQLYPTAGSYFNLETGCILTPYLVVNSQGAAFKGDVVAKSLTLMDSSDAPVPVLVSSTDYYQTTTSNTTAPTVPEDFPLGTDLGGWATSPTYISGQFLWVLTVKEYTDGSFVPGEPICVTGATGAAGQQGQSGPAGANGTDGIDGTDGSDGDDGLSVVSSTMLYYLKSNTTAPDKPTSSTTISNNTTSYNSWNYSIVPMQMVNSVSYRYYFSCYRTKLSDNSVIYSDVFRNTELETSLKADVVLKTGDDYSFYVTSGGHLTCTGATISGTLEAVTGTFGGKLSASNIDIKGGFSTWETSIASDSTTLTLAASSYDKDLGKNDKGLRTKSKFVLKKTSLEISFGSRLNQTPHLYEALTIDGAQQNDDGDPVNGAFKIGSDTCKYILWVNGETLDTVIGKKLTSSKVVTGSINGTTLTLTLS